MSSIVSIKWGNILDVPHQYIAHQCNAVTHRSAHLSRQVFLRFPHADIYSLHTVPQYGEQRKVGNIIVCGDGDKQRYVINMVGQFYPGYPKYIDSPRDGFAAREGYFQSCLDKIKRIENLKEIAFPWRIGCGAAGGNWNYYLEMIEMFALSVSATVFVYGLDRKEMGLN